MIGIEFMVSAFSPDLMELVDPYVDRHKIASSELSDIDLLDKANELRKPVICSTGASSLADIHFAISRLKDVDLTLLYCVSEYPAKAVNFDDLKRLKRFNKPVGFSDHTTDFIEIPRAARDIGVKVYEKHVNFFDVDCADSPHSLNREQFQIFCEVVRTGQVIKPIYERDMIARHNRRLVAIRNISPGEAFKRGENFGPFRSKVDAFDALPANNPEIYKRLEGKPASRYINRGEILTAADI